VTTTYPALTAERVYAQLRRDGEVLLPSGMPRGEQEALTKGVRRKAKADGLRVVAARRRPSRDFRAHHPCVVVLDLVHPANPTTIVAPDARPAAQG
jgi:hypothetical protein